MQSRRFFLRPVYLRGGSGAPTAGVAGRVLAAGCSRHSLGVVWPFEAPIRTLAVRRCKNKNGLQQFNSGRLPSPKKNCPEHCFCSAPSARAKFLLGAKMPTFEIGPTTQTTWLPSCQEYSTRAVARQSLVWKAPFSYFRKVHAKSITIASVHFFKLGTKIRSPFG